MAEGDKQETIDSEDMLANWDPDKPMSLETWIQISEMDGDDFHVREVEKNMKKHFDTLVAGRSNINFFFPCCGKCWDMKWAYDHGHSVVGVDIAKRALVEFFEEHRIDFTTSEIGSIEGNLYKSKDGRIKLYACDLYQFNSKIAGKFDAIYDRKSFVSINKVDQEKYGKAMVELMAKDCRYMLVSDEWDTSLYKGPPNSMPEYRIHDIYGDTCNIEQIEYYDQLTDDSWFKSNTSLKHMYEKVHILRPKS